MAVTVGPARLPMADPWGVGRQKLHPNPVSSHTATTRHGLVAPPQPGTKAHLCQCRVLNCSLQQDSVDLLRLMEQLTAHSTSLRSRSREELPVLIMCSRREK
jgi:hypothetical protein